MDRRYIDLRDCVYYPSKFNIDNQFKVQKGDLLIAMSGATTGKTSIYNYNRFSYLNQRVGLFRPIARNVFYPILYAYVESDNFKLSLGKLLIAGAQPNISSSDIEGIPFPVFSLAEQEKIASFLSLIDERIQSCSETITQMKSLRISFYRTISHQRKREWQNIFLRDILTERKENNSMHCDVYSVSISRGIVNQIEHLGRSFAAKDTSHYNTVHFGDVVYTKSPTGRFPYGIVKQSRVKSAVAVSPLYGVYIPNNYYIGVVLNNFFESSVRTSNYLAPLIQKGAKNTMNITTQHFLDNKILLPTSSEEQKKMADYLILLDERIEVEEELLKQYEMQKKYLLRQMFI